MAQTDKTYFYAMYGPTSADIEEVIAATVHSDLFTEQYGLFSTMTVGMQSTHLQVLYMNGIRTPPTFKKRLSLKREIKMKCLKTISKI